MMSIESPLDSLLSVSKDWADDVVDIAKSNTSSSSVTGALTDSIKRNVKLTNQQTSIRIAFSFARYGVWVEKGAGRGHGGKVGSTWRDKHGTRKRTNPKSLGKMDTGARTAAPWLNPPIDDLLPQLEQTVTDTYAQAIVTSYISIQ
jgi:protoheme ferro-lyase